MPTEVIAATSSAAADVHLAELCDQASQMTESAAIWISRILQLTFALPAMGLVLYTVLKERNPGYRAHFNFRIILGSGLLAYGIHLLSLISTNIYLMVRTVADRRHCSMVHEAWQCCILRWPMIGTIVTFTLVHVALFAERALATKWRRRYEEFGRAIGTLATVLIWAVSIPVALFMFHLSDYRQPLAYCLATVPENQFRVLRVLHCLLAVDLLTTVGDLALQFFSAKHFKSKDQSYTLSNSYQVNENYLTTRLIFPVSLAHSLTNLAYLMATSMVRHTITIRNAVLFVAGVEIAHTVIILGICLTVWMYVRCSGRLVQNSQRNRVQPLPARAEADLYFELFNKQLGWESAAPAAKTPTLMVKY